MTHQHLLGPCLTAMSATFKDSLLKRHCLLGQQIHLVKLYSFGLMLPDQLAEAFWRGKLGIHVASGGSRILCLRGLMGRAFLFGGPMGIKHRRRKSAKLRLPKARSPSRLGDLGERRKPPQWGLGRSPRYQRNFEHFKRKWSTFWILLISHF